MNFFKYQGQYSEQDGGATLNFNFIYYLAKENTNGHFLQIISIG